MSQQKNGGYLDEENPEIESLVTMKKKKTIEGNLDQKLEKKANNGRNHEKTGSPSISPYIINNMLFKGSMSS